jgi:hypothetical protein
MAQWNTIESPSEASDKPLLTAPHPPTEEPGSEERTEEPGANPSVERHEAGKDRAEAPSSPEQLRRRAKQWSQQAKVTLTGSCQTAQRQVQAAMIRTRQRIGRAADQKPVQVIALVSLGALVAGVLLRVWRSSRYE